jgi:NhaP-type Na+/H+ or K+/H+ antiporter
MITFIVGCCIGYVIGYGIGLFINELDRKISNGGR